MAKLFLGFIHFSQVGLLFRLLLSLLLAVLDCQQTAGQFSIADQNRTVSIVYDIEGSASIAANLLDRDIEAVTDRKPEVYSSLQNVEGNVIILGDVTSGMIDRYIDTDRL